MDVSMSSMTAAAITVTISMVLFIAACLFPGVQSDQGLFRRGQIEAVEFLCLADADLQVVGFEAVEQRFGDNDRLDALVSVDLYRKLRVHERRHQFKHFDSRVGQRVPKTLGVA